jgi:DNA-binding NarL/FixJ family response regulator
MIRVLVAEDQALVRAGLVSMLGSDAELMVVADVADGAEAVRQATHHRPDVALLDVRMPLLDGIEATRQIRAAELPTKVIVLTTFGEEAVVLDALRAGADTFLLKDTRPEELLAAVHAVVAGESRIDPAVTGAVLAHFRRHAPVAGSAPSWVNDLTPRERDVLLLLAKGLSNAEIAGELVVAPGTVKTHVASLLAKMGVRDRVQAVVAAYENGLMQA